MKKGFTIIELVIVISVLIILISIAIPRIAGMQQAGNIVKVKGELQTLQVAMESYYNNSTPSVYAYTTSTPCASYFMNATPQIITSPLYDPFATAGTEYTLVTSGSWYVFGSVGTSGQASLGTNFGIWQGSVYGVSPGVICVTNGTGC